MKPKPTTDVADRILQCALRAMPRERKHWAQAMASEFQSVSGANARMAFALGCVTASANELIRTRTALAWIGRSLVAAGVFSMSAYGFLLASRTGAHDAPALIVFLCAAYFFGAVLALVSLRALRLYSAGGLAAACAGLAWFAGSPAPLLGLPAHLMIAISFEAMVIMAALLVAAIYLSLMDSPEPGASEHA
jgi:hypothetical protein